MTSRRSRSRKPSAASSSARRLESAVFYLDESIYSRILAQALEQAGVQVRRPGVDMPFGAADEDWLTKAGDEDWIPLLRDQRVRFRSLERASLQRAGVGAFIVTAGQATAQQVTDAVLTKLAKMVNIWASERKPFIYSLSLGGTLTRLPIQRRARYRD